MGEEIMIIIESFCSNIRNFSYDKAKEIVDEYRNSKLTALPQSSSSTNITQLPSVSVQGQTAAWQAFLQCLPHLALVEKSYMSLGFLLTKGIFRKESALRSNYVGIRTDLQKIIDGLTSNGAETDMRTSVVGHLASQLHCFIDARIELMSLCVECIRSQAKAGAYEKLSTLAVKTVLFDETLISHVEEIMKTYAGAFTHPLLSGFMANFTMECEILLNLLKCHAKLIFQHMFVETLLHLKEAQSVLKMWANLASPAENMNSAQASTWFNFSTTAKNIVLPALCMWLKRYYDFLLSKFTLYFYELLLKQTLQTEMRSHMAKVPENYLQRIAAFHRKQDAAYVCLILHAEGLTHFEWQGYHNPDRKFEELKGVENFPVIFSFPIGVERPPNLIPSAVMIISNGQQSSKLASFECTASIYDDVSYFVCRVEGQLYLLITFKGRKNERDSQITTFMYELCADLRCVKVFAGLKASAKSS